MKPVKDNFSSQAITYQKFRPVYPKELYDEILRHVPARDTAWDCGTGNGQVALVLADHFQNVIATDVSEQQLGMAKTKTNIEYICCRAEKTDFPGKYFDLITVAQAIHWFDFEAFFKEINRVGKKGALLAVWGYGLLRINPEIDDSLDHFYKYVIGPYWDTERQLIDEHYASIPFPFKKIKTERQFVIEVEWNRNQFEGYLNTWSSVQKYSAKNNVNAVDGFMEKIKPRWGERENKRVEFPLFARLGRIG